jgi:hypothetical protein
MHRWDSGLDFWNRTFSDVHVPFTLRPRVHSPHDLKVQQSPVGHERLTQQLRPHVDTFPSLQQVHSSRLRLASVRSTWLQLTETLGANTGSQTKRRCDRVSLVGGNAVPQRYWICSRSSQVLAERRDPISNGVTTEAGTSLCRLSNGNRFDRATHR